MDFAARSKAELGDPGAAAQVPVPLRAGPGAAAQVRPVPNMFVFLCHVQLTGRVAHINSRSSALATQGASCWCLLVRAKPPRAYGYGGCGRLGLMG